MMKRFHWTWILWLSLFLLGCAKGGTYLLRLQYEPLQDFSSLSGKIGPTLGLVPFKDERPDQFYIGIHTPYRGPSSYFKSDSFPLDQAITHSISQALSRFGVKTFTLSHWDGKPDSLRGIEADSVLMVEMKRFWIEGRGGAFRTTVKASLHLVIHLGVKKEGKVFTRNIEVEKEATLARLTPERVEAMVNKALADIFDAFFSNPY